MIDLTDDDCIAGWCLNLTSRSRDNEYKDEDPFLLSPTCDETSPTPTPPTRRNHEEDENEVSSDESSNNNNEENSGGEEICFSESEDDMVVLIPTTSTPIVGTLLQIPKKNSRPVVGVMMLPDVAAAAEVEDREYRQRATGYRRLALTKMLESEGKGRPYHAIGNSRE